MYFPIRLILLPDWHTHTHAFLHLQPRHLAILATTGQRLLSNRVTYPYTHKKKLKKNSSDRESNRWPRDLQFQGQTRVPPFSIFFQKMQVPGIEPGSAARKHAVLPITPHGRHKGTRGEKHEMVRLDFWVVINCPKLHSWVGEGLRPCPKNVVCNYYHSEIHLYHYIIHDKTFVKALWQIFWPKPEKQYTFVGSDFTFFRFSPVCVRGLISESYLAIKAICKFQELSLCASRECSVLAEMLMDVWRSSQLLGRFHIAAVPPNISQGIFKKVFGARKAFSVCRKLSLDARLPCFKFDQPVFGRPTVF